MIDSHILYIALRISTSFNSHFVFDIFLIFSLFQTGNLENSKKKEMTFNKKYF